MSRNDIFLTDFYIIAHKIRFYPLLCLLPRGSLSDITAHNGAVKSRGAIAVLFEYTVKVGYRRKADLPRYFDNALLGVLKHIFRLAYTHVVEILREGCSGSRLEYTAKIASVKSEP